MDIDINIFKNGQIDSNIFKNGLIDIDIYKKFRYIDNRYSLYLPGDAPEGK